MARFKILSKPKEPERLTTEFVLDVADFDGLFICELQEQVDGLIKHIHSSYADKYCYEGLKIKNFKIRTVYHAYDDECTTELFAIVIEQDEQYETRMAFHSKNVAKWEAWKRDNKDKIVAELARRANAKIDTKRKKLHKMKQDSASLQRQIKQLESSIE